MKCLIVNAYPSTAEGRSSFEFMKSQIIKAFPFYILFFTNFIF